MKLRLFLTSLLLSCGDIAAAAPELIWSLPQEESDKGRSRNASRLIWLNDDELLALRYNGTLGRYDCANKTTLWEKRIERAKGIAVGEGKLYVFNDDGGIMLRAFDLKDGSTSKVWSSGELKKAAGDDHYLGGGLEWLPQQKQLVVETAGLDRSGLWFFDTADGASRGHVELGQTSYYASLSEGRYLWQDEKGVLLALAPESRGIQEIWNTGLEVGGDDFPALMACQLRKDGGFVAVVDKGGWEKGADIFTREGPEGKLKEATVSQALQALAIDTGRGRIWATERETGWFGILSLDGKIIAEAKALLPKYCWKLAISPSAQRAAIIDLEQSLLFVACPEGAQP